MALEKLTKNTLARIKTVLGSVSGLSGRVVLAPYSKDVGGGIDKRDSNPVAVVKLIRSAAGSIDFEIHVTKFFAPATANTELDLSTLYDLGDAIIEACAYTSGGGLALQDPVGFGYDGPDVEEDGVSGGMAGGLYGLRFYGRIERPIP